MNKLFMIILCLLLISSTLFAANGDLIVDGNVGIGTTVPKYKLDVHGFFHTRHNTPTGPVQDTSGGLAIGFNRNVGAAETDLYNVYPNAPTAFQFLQNVGTTNYLPLMTITGGGNVGIGTTNPRSKLVVSGVSQIADDASDPDTLSYASFGVTRSAAAQNSSYIGLTKQSTVVYGIGISSNNALIIGAASANPARTIPNPVLSLNGGNVTVNGTFSVTNGTKNFDITDPRYKDEKRRLIHSTLEGPEAGVYYRGEVKLEKGKAIIMLPEYFEALARKENRTVLLTAKYEREDEVLCSVAAASVVAGKVLIKAINTADISACNHSVYWEVKAERVDVDKLQVEETREQ